MITTLRLLIALIFSTVAITPGFSADVYLVQADANGQQIATCETLLWSTDARFANTNTSPVEIRLLDISNTATIADDIPRAFSVAASRVTSINREVRGVWRAFGQPLWVVRLDVPDGVKISNELLLGSSFTLCGPPSGSLGRFGKASLPVFRSLAPANTRQLHLTDLGDLPRRLNIGIYNAGEQEAGATIEFRRDCDNALLETVTARVAADTIIQVGGLHPTVNPCDSQRNTLHVVVIVDQPSFTYVANIIDATTPISGVDITGNP